MILQLGIRRLILLRRAASHADGPTHYLEDAIGNTCAEAIGVQSAALFSKRSSEGSPWSRGPELIFIITADSPTVCQMVVQCGSGSIRKITAAAKFVGIGHPAATEQEFSIQVEIAEMNKPVTRPEQVIVLGLAMRRVQAQPAGLAFHTQPVQHEMIQIKECRHTLQPGGTPVRLEVGVFGACRQGESASASGRGHLGGSND